MKIDVSLETLSLPELLRIIEDGSSSGRLIFEPEQVPEESSEISIYYICFEEGKLVTVTDALNNRGLIDILEKRDWVSKRIMGKIDQLCPSGEPLGVYSKKMKILTSEQLLSLFDIQLDLVYQLFELTSARIRFEEISNLKEMDMLWLEMTGQSKSAIQVAFDGLRMLKNWDPYLDRLPEPNFALKQIVDNHDFELLPLESKIWENANGTTSLTAISEKVNQSLLNVQKAAFGLMVAGLVKEMPPATLWNQNKQVLKKSALNTSWRRKIALALLVAAPTVTAFTIAGVFAGLFQSSELANLDRFFRWRPLEPKEKRITVVTIDDSDINRLGQWPMSDAGLATLVKNLNQYEPRAIGLDIYRDIPVEPGHEELLEVYQSTPNLIVVEKIIGQKVKAPPVLKELDQVAISDIVLDPDGKLRRSLLSANSEEGTVELGLGTKVALMHLSAEGIDIEPTNDNKYKLGKAVFSSLKKNSGGYANIHYGGYQVLLNFRGPEESFDRLSITDVMENNIPPALIRDRVVLIGAIADSLKDFVKTPYSEKQRSSVATPGVFIHANAASQIMSAAIDGRPLLQVWPEPLEWLWIGIWSGVGAMVGLVFLKTNLLKKKKRIPGWVILCIYGLIPGGTLLGISYFVFVSGFWIPVVAPLVALSGSALIIAGQYDRELQQLAFIDDLTQIANRRYLDIYIEEQWNLEQKTQKHLSLILCDIDYFKLYNDFCGSQAGDHCLQQVAGAISKAVNKNHLVARYGGEEFVVVLPKTEVKDAMLIGELILDRVISLQIPHVKSTISDYVTVSCGVAHIIPSPESSPAQLIAMADEALYQAKAQGRARVVNYK